MSGFSDQYSRVLASTPINRDVARVVQPGTHYEPGQTNEGLWFADCPPMQPVTKSMKRNPAFTYLTSRKQGLLTVVGLSVQGGGRWVCRCVCGRYTMRNAKKLKRVNPHVDCCPVCANMERFRSGRRPVAVAPAAAAVETTPCQFCQRPCTSRYCGETCKRKAQRSRQRKRERLGLGVAG